VVVTALSHAAPRYFRTHLVTTQVGAVAEFAVVFPRPRVYRIWVQFQREGIVNTVHFDVPVRHSPR
jgi:hypothetical protein